MKNQLTLFPCHANKSPQTNGSWKEFNQRDHDIALRRLSKGKGLVGVMIPDGHFVIDVDSYKDGAATLQDIEEKIGCKLDWEAALIQTTPRGGEHYLFSVPSGIDLPNTTNLLGCAGIDARASGKGFVCTGEGYSRTGVFEGLERGLLSGESVALPEKAIETLMEGGSRAQGEINVSTFVKGKSQLDEWSLIEWLDALPDSDFIDYDSWMDVLFAVHHATGGAEWGLEVFDAISKERGGEKYAGRNDVAKRWNTAARSGATGAKTFATIAAKVRDSNPVEFERLVVEKKKAEVMNEFEVVDDVDDLLDSGGDSDEAVSANGHEYSERFRTLRGRIDFALRMNAKVCFDQTRDDFTYFEVTDGGFTEKVRGAALRAAAELIQGFEFEACEEDVFEMINEFNDLYTGAAVFGVVPEFMRESFLKIDNGSKTMQVYIQNEDASWDTIPIEGFDAAAETHESFAGFKNNVKRFYPKATKTWTITPHWVMHKFYKVPILTGNAHEIFKPRVIVKDKRGFNQKLNVFQPYRALMLCRDVKTGDVVSGGRDKYHHLLSDDDGVVSAWHVFQQFIFQLVGADIRRIGYPDEADGADGAGIEKQCGRLADGVEGSASEREDWARMLVATMAATVQQPDVRREWALIVKGAQGVGKSTVWRLMEGVLDDNVILGSEQKEVQGGGGLSWSAIKNLKSGVGSESKVYPTDLEGVIGRFNSKLSGRLVCIIEELAIKDKISTADVLKNILTNSVINIEAKGVDVVTEKSYLNFYIFSNKDMPMMLGAERRFSVIGTALTDSDGAHAVNEYISSIPFTNADGTYFLKGGWWGDGPVARFVREDWLDKSGEGEDDEDEDCDIITDEGVVASNNYHRAIEDYKRAYFEKLNLELVENKEALKSLGAALAVVDIGRYCPEFNLKHGFASSEKNDMMVKSVGEYGVPSGDSRRVGNVVGHNNTSSDELCDLLWGKEVVDEMIGSQLVLRSFQSGTLFAEGFETAMIDDTRGLMISALRDRANKHHHDVAVMGAMRVLESITEPLLNIYVVDLEELSRAIPDPREIYGQQGGNIRQVRYALGHLGYTPFMDIFNVNGGDVKRGISVRTMVKGVKKIKWVHPAMLYVFGARLRGGVDSVIGKRGYSLIRNIFCAVKR